MRLHRRENCKPLIRVLIVDAHPIVHEGLTAIIDRRPDMKVIGAAATGRNAEAVFRAELPDVTLIDLRLPDSEGTEVITVLRKECPSARFLVFSASDEAETVYRAVRAGAMGFLCKDAPCEELVNALRTVAGGGKYLPPDIGLKLAQRLHCPEMTGREMEVLRLMALGLRNKEIGQQLFIAETTVKSHIKSLLCKMNVMDRTQAVLSAVEQGLIPLHKVKDSRLEERERMCC